MKLKSLTHIFKEIVETLIVNRLSKNFITLMESFYFSKKNF